MKIVTGKQMQELDRGAIASGVSGDVLMARAGQGAYEEILAFAERLPARHRRRIVIVNGKGNNGGDGYVVARLLHQHTGYHVEVYATCPVADLQGDARLHADRMPAAVPFAVCEQLPDRALCPGAIVVDCLLGTGIRGDVREPYATIIQQINDAMLPVVAMDIPSGVDADTGAVGNVAVHADCTVTMALPKVGLLSGFGARYCGTLRCIDIGIPAECVTGLDSAGEATFADDVRRFVPRLPVHTHKGDMGRIMIIGGSDRFPGAPMLAAGGALRAGGGLVSVAYPSSIGPLLSVTDNAVIRVPVPDDGTGTHQPLDASSQADLLAAQNVVVVGPGLTRSPAALGLVRDIVATDLPLILDADALGVCGEAIEQLQARALTVLTPHPGEMRQLIAHCSLDRLADADRIGQALGVAESLHAIVVLKGHRTVIASPDGQVFINSSGTPALAGGGSGDVLSGVIGALLCRTESPLDAVRLAVFVHGLAAELSTVGMRGLIADDQPALIARALRELSPLA